jgi:hypothetical protein
MIKIKKNRRQKIIRICAVVFLSLTTLFLYSGVNAQINKDPPVVDNLLPSLDIRFEPSGTHVDTKGNLKIRLDFYPTPESKSYAIQHVEVVDEKSEEYLKGYPGELDKEGNPVDQKAYDEWYAKLPKVWVTNPALCHFLTVKPDITKAELDAIVKSLFTGDVTATIDDASIQANSAHLLSPYMRDKSSTTLTKVAPTEDKISLVDAVNARLAGFSIGGTVGGKSEPIQPQSIAVGPGATDRAGALQGDSYCLVDRNTTANGTGTLDTFEMWSNGTTYNTEMATFYVVSGNNLTTRGNANIGTVTTGSKQTFTGLSVSVSTGDYLGVYWTGTGGTKGIEKDSGGSGIWRLFSDAIPCTNTTFGTYTNCTTSLYATGTEAGAGWGTISKVMTIGQAAIGKINGVSKANIGKLNGVTP